MLSVGSVGARSQRLTATASPSPTGRSAGELLGVAQVVHDLARDDGARVSARRVGHLVMPQGVHEGDCSAGAEDANGVVEVLGCFLQVAVQDHQVIAACGHAGKHIQGAPCDEARAVGGDPRGGEVAARMPQ